MKKIPAFLFAFTVFCFSGVIHPQVTEQKLHKNQSQPGQTQEPQQSKQSLQKQTAGQQEQQSGDRQPQAIQKNHINLREYRVTQEVESETTDTPDTPATVEVSFFMADIPGRNFSIGQTEVTQELYTAVTGENPSNFESENSPAVDGVSWYDAVVFCNSLSLLTGKTPCYSVDGKTDPQEWPYTAHSAQSLLGTVEWNREADGFRLPTEEEWEYAAKAGRNTKYAGSDNLDEVGWYRKNAGFTCRDTATKKPNDWELYDMSGNVWEWVWDKYKKNSRYRVYKGGSCSSDEDLCEITFRGHHYPSRNALCYSYLALGFRIAQNTPAE